MKNNVQITNQDELKYTIPRPKYGLGEKYLSFIVHKDKVYNIGVGMPVVLSELGRKRLVDNYTVLFAVLENHYFKKNKEYCTVCIRTIGTRFAPDFRAEFSADKIDEYIEEVKANCISDDPKEYIDYIEMYKATYYDTHLTPEESAELDYYLKNNLMHLYKSPERLKKEDAADVETVKPGKPLFKDWEIPELIIGWIVFTIAMFAISVFKDWEVQLLLRVVGFIGFSLWRTKKIYGIK